RADPPCGICARSSTDSGSAALEIGEKLIDSHDSWPAYRGPRMPDVLIDADTLRSPELRHEIPAGILDPFLYGETGGVAWAAVSTLDAATIAAARPSLKQLDMVSDLGVLDLIAGGMDRHEAMLAVRLRACRELGVAAAVVPPGFPLETAEYLRAGGVELEVDRELFAARRRVKTPAELAGIRRATAAAEAGL